MEEFNDNPVVHTFRPDAILQFYFFKKKKKHAFKLLILHKKL